MPSRNPAHPRAAARFDSAINVTDETMARSFVNDNPDLFRYCHALNSWFEWTGTHWRRLGAKDNAPVTEALRRYNVALLKSHGVSASDPKLYAALNRYRSGAALAQQLTLVQKDARTAVELEDLDPDPDVLNCQNGVADLATGCLAPHDPSLMMTRVARHSYVPGARHEDWDKALAAYTDPATLAWSQMFLGSGCSGRPSGNDLSVIQHGGGSNGKSTILEACFYALGDYAMTVPDSALGDRPHLSDMAQFRGYRLASLDETGAGAKLNVQTIKKLTNSVMKAREMYRDYFEFEPTHTLVASTNNRPVVTDTDWGTWRRLAMVPFTRKFKDEPGAAPLDAQLKSRVGKAADRARGEAVLAWLVEGAIAWYAAGFDLTPLPPEVQRATQDWRAEMDVLVRFADDELEFGPGFETRKSDLWEAFKEWGSASASTYEYRSSSAFSRAFGAHQYATDHGVKETRVGRGDRAWAGVRLKPGGTAALAAAERAAAAALQASR